MAHPVSFGSILQLYSPMGNRPALQQVKDAQLALARNENVPYLDAAIGMHPEINPYDIGQTPQAVILTGDDVKAFFQQAYGVNPAIIPNTFLAPAIIQQLAKLDVGMRQFYQDMTTFFQNRQRGNYQQGLGVIHQKLFAYASQHQQLGADSQGKPIINIQI